MCIVPKSNHGCFGRHMNMGCITEGTHYNLINYTLFLRPGLGERIGIYEKSPVGCNVVMMSPARIL